MKQFTPRPGKRPGQKYNSLPVLQYLLKNADEENAVTMSDIQPRRGAGYVLNRTCLDEPNHPPTCHSGLERQRSGGIYPSCKNNLRKVKLATWEDPSTPFHYGRDDMSGSGSVLSARG